MSAVVQHRISVLRYAQRMSQRQHHFYGAIDRPGDPMPISYFVWLITGPFGPILVDTGFTAETASRFGRDYFMSPPDLVRAAGVDPDDLGTVVLTHLHYDHAGGTAAFPAARFVLQRQELSYWTGPHSRQIAAELGMPHLVLQADLDRIAKAEAEGRIEWVDGSADLAPGVSVHRVGGHTPGMQVVRVETALGAVVLASDAAHFHENLERNRPFAVLESVSGSLAAFDEARRLAADPALVIPGHDPAVLERFPAAHIPFLCGHAAMIGLLGGVNDAGHSRRRRKRGPVRGDSRPGGGRSRATDRTGSEEPPRRELRLYRRTHADRVRRGRRRAGPRRLAHGS
jgi:glyoxylase-like metal-dependent hydrolase (beta-lactamase superfamily II)